MQKDETATSTDSVLNLGSVAKALSSVTLSNTDHSPSGQHGSCGTVSSSTGSFYDAVDYPPLSVAMKKEPLSTIDSPGEGNKNYKSQVGYIRATAPVNRDTTRYNSDLFPYQDSKALKAFNEGLDMTTSAYQRQDQVKLTKGLGTNGAQILENGPVANMEDQNRSYFGVTLPVFPVAATPQKDGEGQRERSEKKGHSEGVQKQNQDGKPIRILQRPTAVASNNAESCKQADEGKMLDALTLLPQKRSHRKKTLSLNPEECEALENLIEEVIIGGFEEDIVSSNGSASDDEESKPVEENKKSPKDKHHKIDSSTRYADRTSGEKDGKLYNHNDMLDTKKNHFHKDLPSKTINKYGRKDMRKQKENDHFNTKAKGDHRVFDFNSPQGKNNSPNNEKDKIDIRVQGLNIYPAQLKVAIKHMDSLPPRFLRRLQSGQNRMDLILPRRLETSPDDRIEQMVENDKGKSKETQLQETKKSIRNLLSDLDQYVDEGMASTPVGKESLMPLSFPISPEKPSKDGTRFGPENFPSLLKQQNPHNLVGSSNMTFLNQQSFTSRVFPMLVDSSGSFSSAMSLGSQGNLDSSSTHDEKSLNYMSRPMVYHCEDVEKLLKSGSDLSTLSTDALYSDSTESKDFVPQAVESTFPGNLPLKEECGLYKHLASGVVLGTKKSQFSVDAPEFVSVFFTPGQSTDAESTFKPNHMDAPPSHGNCLSKPSVRLPMYASALKGGQETAESHEILPSASALEEISPMNFIGTPGSAGHLAQYHPAPYVGSSSLASSTYANSSGGPQMSSELFAPAPSCPPPPPPHLSPHPMVGMNLMPYQPYQVPPYLSRISHPDFPLDQSNYYLPSPNWIGNELQAPNNMPVPAAAAAAMGWCPAGPLQAPYVSCSSAQQMSFKPPMMLCTPGGQQFLQDPQSMVDQWNCMNSSNEFDVVYQKVSDLLSSGGCILVIFINDIGVDLSTLMSQLQMITDDTDFVTGNQSGAADSAGALNSDSSNGSSTALVNSSDARQMNQRGDLPADTEFRLRQAIEGKRRLVLLEDAFAQPWEIQNYIVVAREYGYHVEVFNANEFGQYTGNELAGSLIFEDEYQSHPVMYPPAPPPPHPPPPSAQFINSGYPAAAAMQVARGMIHEVS